MTSKNDVSRRQFLKGAAALGAAAGIGFPTIVPSTVFGATAPSNLIQIAQIGCGRIARDSEMRGCCNRNNVSLARYVAVCDLDSVRVQDAKDLIGSYYKRAKIAAPEIKGYENYRELLADKSIDAVCISTPDHWHAQPAIEAALAGKAIYLQKPASLTIVEGRQMANVVKQTGVVFQQGSQQRSDKNFRKAAELIRNGAIGRSRKSTSACRSMTLLAKKRKCPSRRTSITRCGSARRRWSTTPRIASIRRPRISASATAARAGCVASSSAPA
jgi:hypothetical protein